MASLRNGEKGRTTFLILTHLITYRRKGSCLEALDFKFLGDSTAPPSAPWKLTKSKALPKGRRVQSILVQEVLSSRRVYYGRTSERTGYFERWIFYPKIRVSLSSHLQLDQGVDGRHTDLRSYSSDNEEAPARTIRGAKERVDGANIGVRAGGLEPSPKEPTDKGTSAADAEIRRFKTIVVESVEQHIRVNSRMNSTSLQDDRLCRVQSLIQEIAEKGKDVSLDDAESRRQLVETSRRLCCELESPSEAIFRIVIVQVSGINLCQSIVCSDSD